MNDITHQILSEIHHLLSISGADDLQHVANLPNTSANLRSALNSLAAEKASTSKRQAAKSSAFRPSREFADQQELSIGDTARMSRELARSFERLNKNEIQQACRSVGLQVPMNAKDGRKRIVRRVANALAALPADRRNFMLSELRTKADKQTEGWVEVIRKGR
jgi:hypothetical protein